MSEFLIFTISGIIVGWIPAAAGMWLTWHLAKKQVAKEVARANDAQMTQLAAMNARQVQAMLGQKTLVADPYKVHEQGT